MANLTLWALLWFITLAVDSFLTPPFRQHHHHHHYDKKRVAHCSFSVRNGFSESLSTNAPPFLQWHNQGSSRSKEELLALVDVLLLRNESWQADKQKILKKVNSRYQEDNCQSTRALLAVEKSNITTTTTATSFHTIIPFQWITSGQDEKYYYPLAVQSMVPVLNLTSVAHLRAAADSFWHEQQGKTTSTFTYQRPGNYELHVSDLEPKSKSIVNECLIESIYPLIRNVFWNGDSHSGGSSNNLCVYDALIIRYNATEAAAAAATAAPWTSTKTITTTAGAGQPFHRDFGIVSINIMLNSDDEFLGGGTFFENQLLPSNHVANTTVSTIPLKPRGVGHLLAHYSAERHAGSLTLEGVRDILVIFVTAQQTPPPKLIQCAILKQAQRWYNVQPCETNTEMDARVFRIIQHQRLALDAVPNDGEAWQYLGTALMEYSNQHPAAAATADPVDIMKMAKDCFLHAAVLTPCDSRVYNNLALALQRLLPAPPGIALCIVEHTYEQAWDILDRSNKAGCDVEQEWDALSLNYGLYLSNQDRFQDACRVLSNTAMKKETKDGRIVEDAHRLYEFCKKKIQRVERISSK